MIDEVKGNATLAQVRRGMRVGMMVASGMSPALAMSMADEYRVQRIEWNDDTHEYDITIRHMDEWEPTDVAWIAPDGDVTGFVTRGVMPEHLRRGSACSVVGGRSWANRGRMEPADVTVDGESGREPGNP